MAGLYIHIPFCRKVCFYCDFHFTVSLKNKDEVINAILREAFLKKDYLDGTTIDTIYFGGGTPSVISVEELNDILKVINDYYRINTNVEITLEANPDDLDRNYIARLKNETIINRLSVGIQSFNDKYLIWMNRRHTANEAKECIMNAQMEGFDNINADLIYGIPGMDLNEWERDLDTMLHLPVQHISAYHLTIEPNTVFGRRHKKGFIHETDERSSLEQFELLLQKMKSHGFDHYEISNFAKEGYYSNHNLNYWLLGKYIGLGPSAHSFDGKSRQWNAKINSEYINGVQKGERYCEKEILSEDNIFNEYVMVSLRTKWGADIDHIKNSMGQQYFSHLQKSVDSFVKSGHIKEMDNHFILTDKGKFISDHIIGELFI